MNKENINKLLEKALIYFEKGDLDSCKKVLHSILSIDPDFQIAKKYLDIIENLEQSKPIPKPKKIEKTEKTEPLKKERDIKKQIIVQSLKRKYKEQKKSKIKSILTYQYIVYGLFIIAILIIIIKYFSFKKNIETIETYITNFELNNNKELDEKLIQNYRQNKFLTYLYICYLFKKDKVDDILKIFNQNKVNLDSYSGIRYIISTVYFKQSNLKKALNFIDDLITKMPYFDLAIALKLKILMKLGDYEKINNLIEFYEKNYSDLPLFYNTLGYYYFKINDAEKTIYYWDLYNEIKPYDYKQCMLFANFLEENQYLSKELKILKNLYNYNPSDVNLIKKIYNLAEKIDDKDTMFNYLTKLIIIYPNVKEYYLKKLKLCKELKKFKEGYKFAQLFNYFFPNDRESNYWLKFFRRYNR